MLHFHKIKIINPLSSIICNVAAGLVLTVLITLNVAAQSTVRFTLDTSTHPLDDQDVVMLCGSGATLGEWEVYRHMMSPSTDSPNIYEVEVPFAEEEIGRTISYKYIVVKPGDIQYWEEVASRSLDIPQTNTILDPVFFENRTNIGVTQAVMPVTISVDLNAWEGFDDHIDAIGIKASIYPLPLTLRIESDPLSLSDDDGDGIWTTEFNVLYGTPREFSFSLYTLEQEVWSLHLLYGKQEHVALLPELAPDGVTISLAYSPETGDYVSTSAAELLVNDYPGLYRELGNWAKGTRFQYFAAIEFLRLGQPARARQAYRAYTRDRNTDWDVRDDFEYMWIQYLGETQGTAKAEEYARQVGEGKYEYLRRSYMAKAAEVSFMLGDHNRAKRLVRRLHNNPQFQDRLTWNEYFSRQLLAMSYMEDNHVDSTTAGLQLMELATQDSSDTYWRRNALWQTVYAHSDAGNTEGAVRAYRKLTSTGLPGQRIAARHRLAEYYLRLGDFEQSENSLNEAQSELETQQTNPNYQNWWMRQQLRRANFHEQQGDTLTARLTLEEARNNARPKQVVRLQRALERMERLNRRNSNRGNN